MNGGMSAIGTKRTSASALHMSAFDPKRTIQPPLGKADIALTSPSLPRVSVSSRDCVSSSDTRMSVFIRLSHCANGNDRSTKPKLGSGNNSHLPTFNNWANPVRQREKHSRTTRRASYEEHGSIKRTGKSIGSRSNSFAYIVDCVSSECRQRSMAHYRRHSSGR